MFIEFYGYLSLFKLWLFKLKTDWAQRPTNYDEWSLSSAIGLYTNNKL